MKEATTMHMIMIYAEPTGWTVDYQVGTIYRHTAFVATREELQASINAIVHELADPATPDVSRETSEYGVCSHGYRTYTAFAHTVHIATGGRCLA
jgi:hypothetical protein